MFEIYNWIVDFQIFELLCTIPLFISRFLNFFQLFPGFHALIERIAALAINEGYIVICKLNIFNSIQDGPIQGCSKMVVPKNLPSLKSVTYPAMMKLGTVIAYLKNIQKLYKSRDTPLEFY